MMGGLARLCKRFGAFTHIDERGNKTEWYWDYAKDKARLKNEVTKDEYQASEKIKWTKAKEQYEIFKQH